MNDQFGFDLNPFGIDSFAPQQQMDQQQSQQQQQQQQQHAYLGTNGMQNNNNNNGPCMDNYDPNQVLMQQQQQFSPYNLGMNNGGNKNSSRNSNRHHNSHQLMLPGNMQQQNSRRSSSNSQNSMQQQIQQHLQTGFSDLDHLPMSDKFRNGRSSVQQQLQQQSQSHSNNNLRTQFSYQKQQQQQSYRMRTSSGRTTEKASMSTFMSSSISSSSTSQQSNHYKQQNQQQQQQRQIQQRQVKPKKEEWLEKLTAKVPGVSLEPMTGTQIVDLLRKRANEVLTRYLPCVDFLVQCQQELRKGLQVATTKQYRHNRLQDTYTPRQFHSQYIAQLPNRFYRKNIRTMSDENLITAFKELEKLVANARTVESQGCEVVKNTFLGGMKDGESWGLRKWLSKQGGALHICNDTECLSSSCNKLEREAPSTIKLAARLRPLAAAALKKLKSEIPSSYQEQSSAHPYLPFFHRLECALRGMSNFDPEDDDVIEIVDDDEVEELKAKASAAPLPNKRKRSRNSMSGTSNSAPAPKKKTQAQKLAFDDDDSDIELLEHKPAPKRSNSKKASNTTTNGAFLDFGLDAAVGHNEDESDIMEALMKQLEDNEDSINFDILDEKTGEAGTRNSNKFDAFDLADGLEHIACLFEAAKYETVRPMEVVKDLFWDDPLQYACALRLFCEILRSPDCTNAYLESVDEDELIQEGKLPYTEIVKHPLCFRDICWSLFEDYNVVDKSIKSSSGNLPFEAALEDWNMWKGKELLQAIDLVLLNSLAYGKANDGGGKSSTRSRTNKLRKLLWAGIKDAIDQTLVNFGVEAKRRHTPTRRGESSGFVVKKGS